MKSSMLLPIFDLIKKSREKKRKKVEKENPKSKRIHMKKAQRFSKLVVKDQNNK
jgi:hypothetical protein